MIALMSYLRLTGILRNLHSFPTRRSSDLKKKFIIVENEFDKTLVPKGYTLIDMRHKGDSFKTLVPQNLIFYMANPGEGDRSEEHTSELQSRFDLVCRLLLEKKKNCDAIRSGRPSASSTAAQRDRGLLP